MSPFCRWRQNVYAKAIEILGLAMLHLNIQTTAITAQTKEEHATGGQVTFVSPTPICSQAGQVIVLSVLLQNEEEDRCTFQGSLELPDGWSLFDDSLTRPILIESGSTQSLLLAIKVPAQAEAADWPITFRLENRSSQRPVACASTKVRISARTDLCCIVDEPPPFVVAGSSYECRVCCENHGNISLPICWEAHSDPAEFSVWTNTESIYLRPRESHDLRILVETPLEGAKDQFLFLIARHADSDEILFQRTIRIEVIPYESVTVNPYLTIPGRWRMLVAHNQDPQQNRYFAAGEWVGGGVIDPSRGTLVDFYLREPTSRLHVLFGEEERLFIGFSDPCGEMALGDTVYALSPLLQRGRYGRGAELNFYHDNWEGGAYYVQEVITLDDHIREGGAYLSRRIGTESWLTLNFARRHVPIVQIEEVSGPAGNCTNCPSSPFANADIGSVALELHPTERSIALFEIGQDFSTYDGSKGRYGVYVGIDGIAFCDTHYYLEHARADELFHGDYRDCKYLSMGLDTPLRKGWRWTFSHSQLRQGILIGECTPPVHSFIWQRQTDGCLSYDFNACARIALIGLDLRAHDATERCGYDFRQHWAGFQWGWSSLPWQFNGRSVWGYEFDLLDDQSTNNLHQHSINAIWRPRPHIDYSVFCEWGNLNYFDSETARTSVLFSVRRRHSPISWAEAFGGFSWRSNHQSQQVQPFGERELHLGGRLSHVFDNGHLLYCDAQYFRSEFPQQLNACTEMVFTSDFNYLDLPRNRFEILCSYTIPLDIPVAKRRDIGSVSGLVLDPFSRIPIPGVVINIGGERIMTSSQGAFCMQGLLPGTYELRVDILPPSHVLQNLDPMQITIVGGQDTRVQVAAVPAASVTGDLQTESDVIPRGCKVILSNMDSPESFVSRTNREGHFAFYHLRPGRWQLHIDLDKALSGYQVEANDRVVIARSGMASTGVIRLIKQGPKNIRWIERVATIEE